MRTLWLFRMIALGAALSISAEATVAASKEEWKFIFAMASTDWDVRRGTAVLERSSSSMAGRFVDTTGVEYKLNVKLIGQRVTGRIVILASDNGVISGLTAGPATETVAVKVIDWPVSTGLAEELSITIDARFTIGETTGVLRARKSPSPP